MTRLLSLLGCDLPKKLMPPTADNESGYWESDIIWHLNNRVLASAGTTWRDWLEFNTGWYQSPKAEEFRDEAVAVMEEEFGSSRLFVLKDPRISRILPFWFGVVDAIGATPLIVSPVRNPLEVAASLARRDGIDERLGHLLWLRYMLDAEFFSRGIPRFFASYDRLIGGGWGRIAKDAQSALGLSWPRMSDQAAADIEAFLSERHRHHREAPQNVIDNPALSSWLRDAFHTLSDWATVGEDSRHFGELDQIRMEFNGAAPAFSRLIAAGEAKARKAQQLERGLAEVRAKLGEAESASGAAQEKAKRLEGDLAAAHQRLEEAQRSLKDVRHQLAQTESALAQRRHEAEQTAAELADARGELGKAAAARAESEKIIGGLKEHVVLLVADVKGRQAGLASLQQAHASQLKEKEQVFAATGVQVKKILAMLDTARLEALSKLDAQVKETARRKSEAEAQAAATETALTESRQLKARLAELSEEMGALRRLVGEREGEAQCTRFQAERVRQAAAGEIGRAVAALLNGHRFPFPWKSLRLKRQVHLLKKSGVFDAEWYRNRYRDVAESGMDPAHHYVQFGAKEGRQPNPALAEATAAKGNKQRAGKE